MYRAGVCYWQCLMSLVCSLIKYVQNVDKVRASVRTDYVEILLSPFTSHKTEQVYNKTVADDDDNNGEAVYGNVPPNDVTTQYRIPVKELHNVINEKHTNHEFLKEYRVSVLCIGLCGHLIVVSK